jgi:hypothetical protein
MLLLLLLLRDFAVRGSALLLCTGAQQAWRALAASSLAPS